MSVRPQIPAIEGVQDKQVAGILGAVKNILDSLTGRAPNRSQIKALGANATIASLINKVNELIYRLQGTDVGAASTGSPPASTTSSNFLTANVALSNIAAYFDGPSIAQPSSGTWFVSANILVVDTNGAAQVLVKLTDGTTIIDSRTVNTPALNIASPVSLSGTITNPTGNLRVSANDVASTGGFILFNSSGNSKDSGITAIKIPG